MVSVFTQLNGSGCLAEPLILRYVLVQYAIRLIAFSGGVKAIAASPYTHKLPKPNPTAANYLAAVSPNTSQLSYYSDPDRTTKDYLIN